MKNKKSPSNSPDKKSNYSNFGIANIDLPDINFKNLNKSKSDSKLNEFSPKKLKSNYFPKIQVKNEKPEENVKIVKYNFLD